MPVILQWISQYGYAGLFGLLVLGIVGLPVPDETLLVFSGTLIAQGRLHPLLTWLAAATGSICGMSISYVLGRTLGHAFVTRYGRYVHLTEANIDRVHHWFKRLGHWLLTFGYFIPGVRHFTAFVAGMSELEGTTFGAYAFPGALMWVSMFLALGYFVGERWQSVLEAVHHYLVAITLLALVLGGLGLWLRKRSHR